MKIFLDTNIILDVILKRKKFSESIKLLTTAEKNKHQVITSSISIATSHYITTKTTNKQNALKAIKQINKLVKVTPTTQKAIDKAIKSAFTDFEDALQYYTALEAKPHYFATRNTKHYPKNPTIPVLTPTEILAEQN